MYESISDRGFADEAFFWVSDMKMFVTMMLVQLSLKIIVKLENIIL